MAENVICMGEETIK